MAAPQATAARRPPAVALCAALLLALVQLPGAVLARQALVSSNADLYNALIDQDVDSIGLQLVG